MELRQVRAFVAVAEHLHFGRAAQAIRVTQPALSQRIRQLELSLQAQLLERNSRQVRLSAAGERFLPYAIRIVAEADQALAVLRSLPKGRGRRLRLAHYVGGESSAPARLVALYRQLHPEVEVETGYGYSSANLARLRLGELDAVFVRLPIAEAHGLKVVRVDSDPFWVALPLGHRLAGQPAVVLAQLAGERLISFPREFNPGQYDYIMDAIRTATGAEPTVVLERASAEAMIAAVAEGSGICLCSAQRAQQMQLEGVVFKDLPGSGLSAQLGLAIREEDAAAQPGDLLRLALHKPAL